MKLKQTTLVLALSSITGYAFADLTYRTNYDQKLANNYLQTSGSSHYKTSADFKVQENNYQYENLNSNTISSVAAKNKGGKTSNLGQNYQQYSYDEMRRADISGNAYYSSTQTGQNELSHNESTSSNFSKTGIVTRKANTQVALDANGVEISGTEHRLNDSSFDFTDDDLTKTKDARNYAYSSRQLNTKYTDNVALDTLSESQYMRSDFRSMEKLDGQGQPIIENGQNVYIAVGDANQSQNKNTTYKSNLNQDAKIISQDLGTVLTSQENSSNGNSTSVNYATDNQGKVVGIKLSSDKRYIERESTITNRKFADSLNNIVYDDSSHVKESKNTSRMSEENVSSVWDGFNTVSNSSNETTYIKYQDGAQAIGTEESAKTTQQNTSRDFKKNSNGELVLNNNQPTVDFITDRKSTEDTYKANYQATHHDSGDQVGQDYKILNRGTDSRYTDTSTQKNTQSATYNEIKTYADGFEGHAITDANRTVEYKKNMQENIEVDRTIQQQVKADLQQLRTRVVSAESSSGAAQEIKAGSLNKTISNYNGSWLGSNLDSNKYVFLSSGQEVKNSNINSWVDENGTQRYYVVVGTDLERNDIRSEVTLVEANPLENKSTQINTVFKANNLNTKSENVNYGQELAYNFTEQNKVDESETSKDGQTVYGVNKSNSNATINSYSSGKNALDREIQKSFNTQNMSSDLVLNEQGQVVVKAVNTINAEHKALFQEHQVGQEKLWNASSLTSSNKQSTDANGKILSHDKQTNQLDIVQYAQGKNVLDRKINLVSTQDVLNNQKLTSTAPYHGVDENGVDLSAKNGVLAQDELGWDVKSTQKLETTTLDVINQSTNSKKVDEQIYQSDPVAYKKSENNQQTSQNTFTDGYVARSEVSTTNDVNLYNHGQSDKYRDAVMTTELKANNKIYDFDENGKFIEKGKSEIGLSEKTTAVNYQVGKNALLSSSLKDSTYIDKTVLDTATTENKGSAQLENLVYQDDQKISKQNSSQFNSESKVLNKDQSGFTYTTSNTEKQTFNNTQMGLLASQDVYSTINNQGMESKITMASDGKTTSQNIIRGSELENRTDQSAKAKVYGSENILNADGINTSVSKSNTKVIDKFGLLESDATNRSETITSKDGTSNSTAETRIDNVSGLTLSQDTIQKDKAGKEVKLSTLTTVKAGAVSVGNVKLTEQGVDAGNKVISNVANGVANSDAVNMGQFRSYTTDLNRRFDDVETTAYRGVAISLAAQQAIPNMKPGQFAVFGGMGHYEGESAGAFGVATVFKDGRTSFSGALGVAGGGEVGGRVGVAYVFGGK